MPSLPEIAVSAPAVVRLLVGLASALLLLGGARWIGVGLYAAAFASGAVLATAALAALGAVLPAAGHPGLVALAACLVGLAAVIATRMVRRVAMCAAGALVGLVAGAVVVQGLGAPVGLGLLAAVVGALGFPWIYTRLLQILAPAAGAAGVAWAAGLPAHPLLLLGLWGLGLAVQVGGGRAPAEEEG